MYNKFSRWIDTALKNNSVEGIKALYFSVCESPQYCWTVTLKGTTSFDKQDTAWQDTVITEFDTDSFPFSWREKSDSKTILKKLSSLIKQYLKEGNYGRVIKKRYSVVICDESGAFKELHSISHRKTNKVKIFQLSLLIFGLLLLLALYISEVISGTPPEKNLFKFIIVFLSFITALIKVLAQPKTAPLSLETAYAGQIGKSFDSNRNAKKQLIKGLKLYNENKSKEALAIFDSLLKKATTSEEKQTVHLFAALCFEDMKLYSNAIQRYCILLSENPKHPTALSNLSNMYSNLGDYDNAMIYAKASIKVNPKNHYAYNNLAHAHFRSFNSEEAKKYALEALKLKPGFRQAATLLTIIYKIEENAEMANRYMSLALAGGAEKESIEKAAIIYKESFLERKEFDKKCETWYNETNKPCIQISLRDSGSKSIVGGKINEPSPTAPDGTKMLLLSAIFCSELPKNEFMPDYGVIRFYITPGDYYGADIDRTDGGLNKQIGFKVLYDPDESKYQTTDFDNDDEDFPVFGSFRMEFTSKKEALSVYDYRFKDVYDRLIQEGYDITMTESDLEVFTDRFIADGHKIGGYPFFTQEDPRDNANEYSKYDTLLFQLTSESISVGKEIMFGDSGVCNFFIPKEKLIKKDFSDILYTWDCY